MNVYRMVVVGEHDRRQRYLNGEYRAAAVLAAGLIRAPWQFAALIDHLVTTERCDHDSDVDIEITKVLATADGRCQDLATVLADRITAQPSQDQTFAVCADVYRRWAVKIARYGFETYKHFNESKSRT
ncbi:hypothetical protein GCM10029964_087390 [Kibdelosporangium lantanae]